MAVAFTWRMPPDTWVRSPAGIFIRVTTLDDPLLRIDRYRVVAHRDDAGHVWVRVGGANAGVAVQTAPPEEFDDGGPL